MIISLIAAMGTNRVIGNGPKMPWQLPDELAYFMQTTKNHWVLMGRLTFESYKNVMRNHKVIVVTSQIEYDAAYAIVATSISEGIEIARKKGETELFISGGGQIFKDSMAVADKIYLTIIDYAFKGDVFFPEFDLKKWNLESEQNHDMDEKHQYPFTFYIYSKK